MGLKEDFYELKYTRLAAVSGEITMTVPILFSLAVLLNASQSVFGKLNGRAGGDSYIFNLVKSFAAFAVFLVAAVVSGERPDGPTVFFSLLNGVFMTVANYCGYVAITTGPMAIANIVASFSLVFPTLWGLLFLNESMSATGIVGFVMIFLALLLINLNGKSTGGAKMTLKWWLFSFATMLANGCFSIVQIVYNRYSSDCKFSYLSGAMLVPTVVFLAVCALKRRKAMPVKCVSLSAASGVSNGLYNLMTFLLISLTDVSLIFPIVAVISSVLVALSAFLLFKEKLGRLQLLGFVTGIVAVFLMKL